MEATNPKVSIIIPVYNVELYLCRCLDSVLAQTYTDFEVICVDDGSVDRSGLICDEYAEKDTRVRVIHIANSGVSNARNIGIEHARGEYLFFIDSDDWIDSQHVQLLLPIDNEDFVYGGCNVIFEGKVKESNYFSSGITFKEEWQNRFGAFWREYPMHSPCCGCYRKSIVEVGGLIFDKHMTIGEDEHFNIRYVSACNAIRFVSSSTYRYYVSEHSSAMQRYHPNRTEDAVKICQEIEAVSDREEHSSRWYYWHSALAHYEKWKKASCKEKRKEVVAKLQECYANEYFRECLPYIRQNGTFDGKLETYFMRSAYRGIYRIISSGVAAVAALKAKVTKKG